MLSVTLRQLEYAVGVARHGSVSAAAAALNVSQPSLSHHDRGTLSEAALTVLGMILAFDFDV